MGVTDILLGQILIKASDLPTQIMVVGSGRSGGVIREKNGVKTKESA